MAAKIVHANFFSHFEKTQKNKNPEKKIEDIGKNSCKWVKILPTKRDIILLILKAETLSQLGSPHPVESKFNSLKGLIGRLINVIKVVRMYEGVEKATPFFFEFRL